MTYPNTETFARIARVTEGGPKIFCETGTWEALSITRCKGLFDRRISIEIDERIWRAACKKVPDTDAWLLHGDSRDILPLVCRVIREPIFFWLDGHFCGPEGGGTNEGVPLFAEIEIVLNRQERHDIIAIDDLLQMGTIGRGGVVDWRHISSEKVIERLKSAGMDVDISAKTFLVARWLD